MCSNGKILERRDRVHGARGHEKLQSERLVKQVKHVWDNVPYYKKLMEEKGVTPDDIHGIEDLHKLPFISKADLREAYPYGLLAKPLSECVRIHSTSGTTGKRVVAFYTQHDIDIWENCCARAIVAAGGTKDDVCHIAYGYGLFTGEQVLTAALIRWAALLCRCHQETQKDRYSSCRTLVRLSFAVLRHMPLI